MRCIRFLTRNFRRPLTARLFLVASLLLLAATIVSSFHSYGVDIEIATEKRWSEFNLAAGDGKLWIHAVPERMSCYTGPPDRSSINLWQRPTYTPFFKVIGLAVHPIAGHQTTWSTRGTDHWYYLSGWIPTGFVFCLFVIAFRVSPRQTAGTCGACGYPRVGLPTPMCPECGLAEATPRPDPAAAGIEIGIGEVSTRERFREESGMLGRSTS